jgi:hypothetical protein
MERSLRRAVSFASESRFCAFISESAPETGLTAAGETAPGRGMRWGAAVSVLAAAGAAGFCKTDESDEVDRVAAEVLFPSFIGSPIAKKKKLLKHKRKTGTIVILTCGYTDIMISKIQGAIPLYERKMPQKGQSF